VVNVL